MNLAFVYLCFKNNCKKLALLPKPIFRIILSKSFGIEFYTACIRMNNENLANFVCENNSSLLRDEGKKELVLYAYERGYVEVIRYFNDHGFDIWVLDKNHIYRACEQKQFEMALYLHIIGVGGSPKRLIKYGEEAGDDNFVALIKFGMGIDD